MTRTKVFLTDAEKAELLELYTVARSTPVIAMSSAHAMRGGMAGDAYERLTKRTHALALVHGLPEFKGYYGADLENGEFVTA